VDILANIVLYIPFGYVAAVSHRGLTRRLIVSMSTAGVLSFILETSQLFSVTRYPSATDLACDIAGAAAGAVLASVMTPFLRRPERGAFIPHLSGDAGSRASRLA
jgi:glycopeptide antibiotics resistance protein